MKVWIVANPSLVVLGGPNGSGKSTAAVELLKETLSVIEFVNADEIARGLSPFNPDGVAIQAGRIMLDRIQQLARHGESFAFESTLASRSFAPLIRRLQHQQGYFFRLVYIWLKDPMANIGRVQLRVESGGHHVPDETVRRRYFRSIRNLIDLYLPLANTWEVFDNSTSRQFQLVASGTSGSAMVVKNPESWSLLRAQYDAAGNE